MHIVNVDTTEFTIEEKRLEGCRIDIFGGSMRGMPHRKDGPCLVSGNVLKFALNGNYYSFNEYLSRISEEDRILVRLRYSYYNPE